MTKLAELAKVPGRQLLATAADMLRGDADRIRCVQDGLVAAGILPAWAEGQEVRRALLMFAAGALEQTAVGGAEEPATAHAQRRKVSTAHRDIVNAGRSEIIGEIQARAVAPAQVIEATEAETEGAAA